jgi:Ni2+-binding GTPase involved in maturation of urease and hydrogenase
VSADQPVHRLVATRLILLGGFLGAGKTTTLLRLARHWTSLGRRVGIITNDQGENLVDTGMFRAAALDTAEVAGGCFCCRFDDFVARADDLLARFDPDVILAEPVGSCTDLVATVIEPLGRLHAGRFEIAPYTVLVDPIRVLQTFGGRGGVSLSEKITYIYRMQQVEAQCLAVNKCDLLSEADRLVVDALLEERFPNVPRFAFSARTGEGFEPLINELESRAIDAISANNPPSVDYAIYREGESELAWLNTSLELSAANPIDIDGALVALAEYVRHTLVAGLLAVGHVKLLARTTTGTAVANITRDDAPAELSQPTGAASTSLALVANLRVAGDPLALHHAWLGAFDTWANEWGVEVVEGTGQCFKPSPPAPPPQKQRVGA